MNTNMTKTFITLQFSDNVKIKLSTSSFLFKESKLFKILEIDINEDITTKSLPTSLVPILCPSTYVLDDYNEFLFNDKTDISFIFNNSTNLKQKIISLFSYKLQHTKFINLCHFLDIIEYETNDISGYGDDFSMKINQLRHTFILYVMKYDLIHQLKDLHVFMCAEIKSILNYTENISADIQIRTCTPLFYKLFLSEYKEEIIKYGRIDIYNEIVKDYPKLQKIFIGCHDFYKYIHIYNNQLTYNVKETDEYKLYIIVLGCSLCSACNKENNITKIVELVEHGADINIYINENTPLHYASYMRNNLKTVQYLVEHGANISLQNKNGWTALHFASSLRDNLETIQYLVENGADVNLQDNNGCTALQNASCMKNNLKTVQYLVEHGADVNLQNKYQSNALHCAIQWPNNLETIQYLIEHGTNIKNDNTLLYSALWIDDNLDVIKYLININVDVNAINSSNSTPLHYASNKPNNLEVIQYLIEHGADINMQNNIGETSLHIACRRLNDEKLMRHNNITAVHISCHIGNNIKSIQYLVNCGINRDKQYMSNTSFINIQDNEGNTALHIASEINDNLEVIEYLIKNGADFNLQNNQNCNALDVALKYHNTTNIINYLQEISNIIQ